MNVRQLERRFDVEQYLGKFSPKSYGDERAVRCPMCDKAEKLWVNVKKRTSYCYYCDDGYSLFNTIMLLEDCGMVKAMEVIVSNARIVAGKTLLKGVQELVEEVQDDFEDDDDELPPRMKLPKEFVSYNDVYPRVPRYFRERGIGPKRAWRYRLGFCTGGFYFNRLIVPIYFRGKVRGFHPRYMQKEPPPGVKKVQYPKGMKSNRLLFNWDVARKKSWIVLVEDPFSAMAVGTNATASFGTRLSPYHVRMLARSNADRITILWDLDALAKAHKEAEKLITEGLSVDVAVLPDARDPDELSKVERTAVLQAAQTTGLAARLRSRLI